MSQTPKTKPLLSFPMTSGWRFLIGGAGALAPIMVNLLVVDMHSLFSDMARDPRGAAFLVLEYAIKVVVLFCVGGVVAFLHTEETQPTKLFEFGLGAPAMILTAMNGLAVGDLKTENQRVATAAALVETLATAPENPPVPVTPVAACLAPEAPLPENRLASEKTHPLALDPLVVPVHYGKGRPPLRMESASPPPKPIDLQAAPPEPMLIPNDMP